MALIDSSRKRRLAAVFLLVCSASTLALPCSASRTVTDETGRRMVIPDHPHRVISLAPSVTDSIYAIGAGEDVVGVDDYAKYPAEAVKKPRVGSILTPSLETIVALHPDLLLATKTESGASSVEKLRGLGIPIFLVDPHGIDGIFHSLISLGDALDRRAAAQTVVVGLQTRLAKVRAGVKGKPVVSLFLPIWYDPVITIGRRAFLTEMIAAAGGRSVTDDLSQEWPQISMEAVVARSPDALLLGRNGKITLDMLKIRPGWQSLPAVLEGRVFYLDGRMDLTSPVAFDALEELAKQLHPS